MGDPYYELINYTTAAQPMSLSQAIGLTQSDHGSTSEIANQSSSHVGVPPTVTVAPPTAAKLRKVCDYF